MDESAGGVSAAIVENVLDVRDKSSTATSFTSNPLLVNSGNCALCCHLRCEGAEDNVGICSNYRTVLRCYRNTWTDAGPVYFATSNGDSPLTRG